MDMATIMQLLVLGFGMRELWNAKKYHKQRKKNWAIASLCVGAFACACGIIALTGLF